MTDPESTRAEKEPRYVLRMWARGIRATALFNDWGATRALTDENAIKTQLLNHYVVEGKNVVRLLARPSGELAPGEKRTLELEVVKGSVHIKADDVVTIFRYCFDEESSPLSPDGDVEVARHELSFVKAFGRWQWEDAIPYANSDRPAVIAALAEVHAALANKDIGRFLSLCRPRLEEQARATYRDPAAVMVEQEKWVGALMTYPTWALMPLEPEKLILDTWAGGRLVEIWGPDHTSPLRVLLDGVPAIEFDITMSQLGNAWLVTR